MEENEVINAISESLPEDGNADSSTAEGQASQPEAPVVTPTQQVEQEKEVPFHLNPRWQERQRELEDLRRQNQELLQIAQRQPIVQTVAPAVDPEANLSPEEKQFWAKQRQIAREEALKVAEAEKQGFNRELRETKETTAALMYERFLNKNPDILPGSEDEAKVVQYFQRGYTLDDAASLVRLPKLQRELELQKTQKQVQKVQQKVAATQETTTVAPKNGLPEKKHSSIRDFVTANWP